MFFAQEHPPGRLGLSDFTVCDELEVDVAGVAFPHRLYQFALAHSGWRHAAVIEGGESFMALSTGLQAALWRLGGVPEEHRTDSLSAAFNNLAEQEELTRRYDDLCKHYGMRASRCNPGQSKENGSIESRHDSLKTALDQALRLRGSRASTNVLTMRRWSRRSWSGSTPAWQCAGGRAATLRPLPERRTAEFEEVPARVSKYAIFTVGRPVQRAQPTRRATDDGAPVHRPHRVLAGWHVRARSPRDPPRRQRHPRDIDYRHLVGALRRKPGAFARSVLRDAMFPRAVYRQTWERLSAQLSEREACKTIVGLLSWPPTVTRPNWPSSWSSSLSSINCPTCTR